MSWKRGLGIGLIFAGIFIIASARVLTGAVVGVKPENYLGIFGVLVLAGGILLVLITKTLEERVGIEKFETRIRKKEHDKKKTSLILDTSAILPYSEGEIEELLMSNENVFVPDSVLEEINDFEIKKALENNSKNIEGYEKYRKVSRGYLERTDKPQLRRELLLYLKGEKVISSGSEKVRINKLTERLRRTMLKEKGLDEGGAMYLRFDRSDILDYLQNCGVSEADVDVLAMALYEARGGQHAIIGERDIHLRQAVDLIKKEHPKLGKKLDYVEVYGKE